MTEITSQVKPKCIANCDAIPVKLCPDELYGWSQKWLLHFHPDKCKIMLIGNPGDEKELYMPNSRDPIKEVTEEKDLGVIIDNKLIFRNDITQRVNKANRIMGTIRRTFHHLDKHNFNMLFKSMVRPHLEYAAPIWNPSYKKDIELLEKVERRATKLVSGYKNMGYKERLCQLELPTLAFRRHRGDIIEVFKLYNFTLLPPLCA